MLVAFFAGVLGLIASSAVLGFVTGVYLARPMVFRLIALHLGRDISLLAQVALGLALSILLPVVGGLTYAVSGTSWMTRFFGDLGQFFWAWAAGTYLLGFLLACMVRAPEQ